MLWNEIHIDMGPCKEDPLYVINRKMDSPICHKQKYPFEILNVDKILICHKQKNKEGVYRNYFNKRHGALQFKSPKNDANEAKCGQTYLTMSALKVFYVTFGQLLQIKSEWALIREVALIIINTLQQLHR